MSYQPQPTVISARASVYSPIPVIPEAVKEVEMLSAERSMEIIKGVLDEAGPLEGAFLNAVRAQDRAKRETGREDHGIKLHIQAARQKLNTLISLRKHMLAQALGLSDSEFVRRHLPKQLDGFWFCRDGNPFDTPAAFLRHAYKRLAVEANFETSTKN